MGLYTQMVSRIYEHTKLGFRASDNAFLLLFNVVFSSYTEKGFGLGINLNCGHPLVGYNSLHYRSCLLMHCIRDL